jgi:protein-disulfide isomerase
MSPIHPSASYRHTAATRLRHLTIALVAGAITACAGTGSEETKQTEDTSPAIVRVDGHTFSANAVDARIKDDLFEEEFGAPGRSSALYDARREVADVLVDEYLLERAAERAGLAPEDWVEQQLAALPPISDEEMQAFFQEHRDRIGPDVEYAPVRERIRAFLERQRVDGIQEQLRADAQVSFMLPRQRFEVAATGPALGPDDAPVTIVEFSDYQCPFCGRVEPTIKELLARYPTQIRVVYRHLPLSFHPLARGASEAAACADDQERFWAFHDLLFENQKNLEREDLLDHAETLDLDLALFEACLDDPATAARVQQDFDAARSLGATATPSFFINGIMLTGAQPISSFEAVIDEELRRLQPES